MHDIANSLGSTQPFAPEANGVDEDDRYHFNVIKRAIAVIDAADHPLSLDALAEEIGMNAQHFQRVFSKWAGVSPKRYQQYLALDHAKLLLRRQQTTSQTAQTIGLSGTGRLHDLFIRWEAMTPGAFAQGGAGETIGYDFVETPFGDALAMATSRGLCGLAFCSDTGRARAFDDMKARWPHASYTAAPETVRPYVDAALGGGRLDLHVIGAPFQIKVWEALLAIPDGSVATYSDIADAIGNPRAVRAVASSIGKNPISWLIPCHRVLRKNGELGGYHWGQTVKRAILAREAFAKES